jgi:hypothetical protein
MLVRRRKVTIEVEQKTLRVEVSSSAPVTPNAEAGKASFVGDAETLLAKSPETTEPKKLKSGEAL